MKKNILVTGSNGFIGRNLVQKLKSSGYNVSEFDLENGDISNFLPDLKSIDHVFHLAALTYVPDSWLNPSNFYRVNVIGTVNVMEFCRKMKCSFTYINSYPYGIPLYLPIDEKHPLQPNTPYNQSKLLGENVCSFYHQFYGLKGIILRPFNVYGPGQRMDFLIPKIIRQIFDTESDVIIVNDLSPKRDYLYIDDFINLLQLTIEYQGEFEILNAGSGISYSVEEIINAIISQAEVNISYKSENQTRFNEVPDLYADIRLAKKALKWESKTTINQGIKKTIQEFKKSHDIK